MDDFIRNTFVDESKARVLVERVISLGKRFRTLHEHSLSRASSAEVTLLRERDADRKLCFLAAKEGKVSFDETVAMLRSISLRDLEQLTRERFLVGSAVSETEVLESLKKEHRELTEQLTQMLCEGRRLPWRLNFALEMDPLDANGKIDLGGGAITDADGRNIWADYCACCYCEIINGVARWRCLDCAVETFCEECVELRKSFGVGSGTCKIGVWETCHPCLIRLDIPTATLSAAVDSFFRVYAKRPCFGTRNAATGQFEFMSYEDVYKRIESVTSFLKARNAKRVAICVANDPLFYVVDIACLLLRIPTVGIHVDSSDEHIRAAAVGCDLIVKCERDVIDQASNVSAHFDLTSADSYDEDYTVFYTSGSSGAPKGVRIARAAFLFDILVPSSLTLTISASFLPPCWGADRLSVYQTLFNGGRVGFCVGAGSNFMKLFEDIAALEPTYFFAPPAVFSTMYTLSHAEVRRVLGSRVRLLGSGGSAIDAKVVDYIKQAYRGKVPFAVAYGISEVGGVCSDEKLLPGVSVRIEDAEVQPDGSSLGRVWLKKDATSSRGYVGNEDLTRERFRDGYFDTGDVGILSADGKSLRILGRADLSAIKLNNGTWFNAENAEGQLVANLYGVSQAFCTVVDERIAVILVTTAQKNAAVLQKEVQRILQNFRVGCVISVVEPLPTTVSMKLDRRKILQTYGKDFETRLGDRDVANDDVGEGPDEADGLVLAVARELLPSLDPTRSLLENGASSLIVQEFVQRLSARMRVPDWRGWISKPLNRCMKEEGNSNADVARFSFKHDVESLMPVKCKEPLNLDVGANGIFLTGVTGFVGSHFLQTLPSDAQVYCLVRRSGQIDLPSLHPRAVEVVGDLELDRFGLPEDVWADLVRNVTRVYHFAARINFVDTYDAARAANVMGTLHVANLCVSSVPTKRLFHISTLSASDDLAVASGYGLTKFCAEVIAKRVPGASVLRLPFVSFNTKTGRCNLSDWVSRIALTCLELNVVTSIAPIPCVPVLDICPAMLERGDENRDWPSLQIDVLLRGICGPDASFLPLEKFIAFVQTHPNCSCYALVDMLLDMVGNRLVAKGSTLIQTTKDELEKLANFLKKMQTEK